MRFLAVMERDLRKFWRNPIVMAMSIAMPLLYLVILGNTFHGELKNLPLAIVDQDKGPYSRRIMELLQALEAGPQTVKVTSLTDQVKAIEGVKAGVYKGALIIPKGFSRGITLGKGDELGFFTDNTDSVSSDAIHQALMGALSAVTKVPLSVDRTSVKGPSLRRIELYRKVDYDQSLIPGVVIMAIFMGTMVTGVFNMVMDKFLGTHESYLLTPLTRRDIVVGLMLSGLLVTMVISLIVLVVGILITQTPIAGGLSSLLAIVLLILLTSLGLLGMMFILLGRANHPRIVGVFSGFLNVIFFFPSGAIYPIESFPGWLQAFALVNPEAYAVDALKTLMFKGYSLVAIQNDLLFLGIFALLMVTIATITFKRRL